MTRFEVHSRESAPAGARAILEQAEEALGFVPNLHGVLAESPATLKAYTGLGKVFDSTSFDATERQVVLLSAILENECDYCMAAHSTIAGMQGVPESVVRALRAGEALPDGRLQALSRFTRKVVRERGWVSEDECRAFLDAGFTRAQLLEVLVGVALETLSNYANHVARTPVDEAFRGQTWAPPGGVTTP